MPDMNTAIEALEDKRMDLKRDCDDSLCDFLNDTDADSKARVIKSIQTYYDFIMKVIDLTQ